MTVTWVMIIGGAEELFVSAAAKAKNSATQISADSRTGLEITAESTTMENKRAGNVSSVPRATRKRQPPHP